MKPTVTIENFDIETELQCRCGCGRYNYEDEFLIRAQAFRYLLNLPMTVTSGGRCVKHNKNVGGVDTSLHQCETKKASAMDFTCSKLQHAYDLACKSGLFNEVILYKTKRFIHIGWDKNQKGFFYQIK